MFVGDRATGAGEGDTSIHSKIELAASPRVAQRTRLTGSFPIVAKELSPAELSRQSPRRLMLHTMPASRRRSRELAAAQVDPRSECAISSGSGG